MDIKIDRQEMLETVVSGYHWGYSPEVVEDFLLHVIAINNNYDSHQFTWKLSEDSDQPSGLRVPAWRNPKRELEYMQKNRRSKVPFPGNGCKDEYRAPWKRLLRQNSPRLKPYLDLLDQLEWSVKNNLTRTIWPPKQAFLHFFYESDLVGSFKKMDRKIGEIASMCHSIRDDIGLCEYQGSKWVYTGSWIFNPYMLIGYRIDDPENIKPLDFKKREPAEKPEINIIWE